MEFKTNREKCTLYAVAIAVLILGLILTHCFLKYKIHQFEKRIASLRMQKDETETELSQVTQELHQVKQAVSKIETSELDMLEIIKRVLAELKSDAKKEEEKLVNHRRMFMSLDNNVLLDDLTTIMTRSKEVQSKEVQSKMTCEGHIHSVLTFKEIPTDCFIKGCFSQPASKEMLLLFRKKLMSPIVNNNDGSKLTKEQLSAAIDLHLGDKVKEKYKKSIDQFEKTVVMLETDPSKYYGDFRSQSKRYSDRETKLYETATRIEHLRHQLASYGRMMQNSVIPPLQEIDSINMEVKRNVLGMVKALFDEMIETGRL